MLPLPVLMCADSGEFSVPSGAAEITHAELELEPEGGDGGADCLLRM
jgi:hypothetical protein